MSMMMTNITIRSVTTKSKANTSISKGGDVLLSLVFNDKNSRSLQISAKHIVYRCALVATSLLSSTPTALPSSSLYHHWKSVPHRDLDVQQHRKWSLRENRTLHRSLRASHKLTKVDFNQAQKLTKKKHLSTVTYFR